MSARTHTSHRGRRASQTRRPWRIMRRLNRPRSTRREVGVELHLHLHRVVLGGQTQAPAEPPDVGVHGQSGEVEGHAAHDVGRLAPHPRQGHQIVQAGRDLTVEALDQGLGHANEAPGLVGVEPGRAHDLLQVGELGPGQRLRRRVAGEQRGRDHVDPDVGRLGGEDGGGQELERVVVVQLTDGVGVLVGQTAGHLTGPSLRCPRSPHRHGNAGRAGGRDGHRERTLGPGPQRGADSLRACGAWRSSGR